MRPDDHVIVIAGATGDLAKRKLIPGLYHLDRAGLLPEQYRIIGSAPNSEAMSDEAFRKHARDAVDEFGNKDAKGPAWDAFEQRVSFAAADSDDPSPLVKAVDAAEEQLGENVRAAVPPRDPARRVPVDGHVLGDAGLSKDARVIIEKPFGTDLESAKALNATVHKVFDESHVFRIDHYLGKETVDNLLAFRFANGLFEPIWNRTYIENVQIDVPEALSIEGRAAFYEKTGCFRDMVVTHLFQVLGFLAMEEPTRARGRPAPRRQARRLRVAAPAQPAARRARPVRRLPRRRRGRARLRHRDVRRGRGADRQRALARRAVLPAGRASRSRRARTRSRSSSSAPADVDLRRAAAQAAQRDHLRPRGARRDRGDDPRQEARTRRCTWGRAT